MQQKDKTVKRLIVASVERLWMIGCDDDDLILKKKIPKITWLAKLISQTRLVKTRLVKKGCC